MHRNLLFYVVRPSTLLFTWIFGLRLEGVVFVGGVVFKIKRNPWFSQRFLCHSVSFNWMRIYFFKLITRLHWVLWNIYCNSNIDMLWKIGVKVSFTLCWYKQFIEWQGSKCAKYIFPKPCIFLTNNLKQCFLSYNNIK